jgi:hypothetical protein
MDWLGFISQMTSALAWPIVALVAVLFLRSEIKDAAKKLVDRVGEVASLKAPGVAVEFIKNEAKELAVTNDALKQSPAIEPLESTPLVVSLPKATTRKLPDYTEYAERVNTLHAVELAFQDFEFLLRQEFFRRYPSFPTTLTFGQIVDVLRAENAIPDQLADALKGTESFVRTLAIAALTDENTRKSSVYTLLNGVKTQVDYMNRIGFFRDWPDDDD